MVKICTEKEAFVTPDLLRSMLKYDPRTGELIWRYRPNMPSSWNGRWAGKPAGSAATSANYAAITVTTDDGCFQLYKHRVAWAIVHGLWPEGLLDHWDNDKSNNRISNLREANFSKNGANRKTSKSVTGYKGVRVDGNGFVAMLRAEGRDLYLGYFGDAASAARAYDRRAREVFGPFARTNFNRDHAGLI